MLGVGIKNEKASAVQMSCPLVGTLSSILLHLESTCAVLMDGCRRIGAASPIVESSPIGGTNPIGVAGPAAEPNPTEDASPIGAFNPVAPHSNRSCQSNAVGAASPIGDASPIAEHECICTRPSLNSPKLPAAKIYLHSHVQTTSKNSRI